MAGPICIYTLFLYIMCTSDCVAASLLVDGTGIWNSCMELQPGSGALLPLDPVLHSM
jgi:hypothetical protein